ncbi:MAG: hypothetical protein M1332_05255 [Deltaproteobacteria bacterium]|nr:hypothetical protein [Deltaproteobacteria bacterium]
MSLRSIEIKKNETVANFVIQNLQQKTGYFFLDDPHHYTYIMDQDDNQYNFISTTFQLSPNEPSVPIVKKNFTVQFAALPLTTQKIDILLRISSYYCDSETNDVAIKNIKLQ